MAYLVASAERRDISEIRKGAPELWRQVRRYNLPVQLALGSAFEVAAAAADITTAALVSLAPCRPGSADLYRWGPVAAAGIVRGKLGEVRLNPTLTLHAVDNLALSAFAIAHGNRAYCLGLGGAAGQAWCAIEAVLERLDEGIEAEALLMAGDQNVVEAEPPHGSGVALLFSRVRRPYSRLARPVRIVAVERRAGPAPQRVIPDAVAGLSGLLRHLTPPMSAAMTEYHVPREHCDGIDSIRIVIDVEEHV